MHVPIRHTFTLWLWTNLGCRAAGSGDVDEQVATSLEEVLVSVFKTTRSDVIFAPFEPIRVQLTQHRTQIVVLEVLWQHVVGELERVLDEDGGATVAPMGGCGRASMSAHVICCAGPPSVALCCAEQVCWLSPADDLPQRCERNNLVELREEWGDGRLVSRRSRHHCSRCHVCGRAVSSRRCRRLLHGVVPLGSPFRMTSLSQSPSFFLSFWVDLRKHQERMWKNSCWRSNSRFRLRSSQCFACAGVAFIVRWCDWAWSWPLVVFVRSCHTVRSNGNRCVSHANNSQIVRE